MSYWQQALLGVFVLEVIGLCIGAFTHKDRRRE
jgi:hypothetical protein